MDRNQVIGFSLIVALLIGYFAYNSHSQKEYQAQKRKQEVADSIAYLKAHPTPVTPVVSVGADTTQTAQNGVPAINDSALAPALRRQAASFVTLENADLALTFSTKGARPVKAHIKNYKTFGGDSLILFSGAGNGFNFTLPTDNGRSTDELTFTATPVATTAGAKAIDFAADLGGGKRIDIIYSLPAEKGMAEVTVRTTGMNANSLPFTWEMKGLHSERDITTERQQAQVYHRDRDGDVDYESIAGTKEQDFKEGINWVGLRLHYFSSAIISEDGLSRTSLKARTDLSDSSGQVAMMTTKADLTLRNGEGRLRWYVGANHYQTLKSFKIDLDEMVPLGFGPFFFVKYINKGLIIPAFNFLHGTLGILNMGVIIMLLTLFIRLLLSFFTYKSYLSSAKMRVLKPELDELRAKFGEDKQAMSMEQMKMYREAGVNPLGGCLPTLFQIPILFAMYYFFPSSIELRQKSFLWATDLSTYDSVLNLPFTIPFYGDHVSLFTLLMTASSLFLAIYNRNLTPQDPNNPLMKWLPFIFPVLLMGVFNKMAAALTFYYFFSNMLSILQQFIIQKFIIDEKKIHAQIQLNRTKPPTQSKWAARLAEMQQAQQERAKGGKK
jgi:YidC/Oxa1 family membrane protein insertase